MREGGLSYVVREISTHTESGHLYVLVDFWQGAAGVGDPYLTNDFIMQIEPTGTRWARDADGNFLLLDGSAVKPGQADDVKPSERKYETFAVDVKAVIMRNIEVYAAGAMALQWSGDATADATKPFKVGGVEAAQAPSDAIERDASDPKGLLAMPDVAALVGKAAEVAPLVDPVVDIGP